MAAEFEIGELSADDNAGKNIASSPSGAPENMAPAGVNNTIRAIQGALRRFYDDSEYRDPTNDGTGGAAGVVSQVSVTEFKVVHTGVDYSLTVFLVGRRVKLTGGAAAQYGFVTAAVYSGGDTTTVTMDMDATVAPPAADDIDAATNACAVHQSPEITYQFNLAVTDLEATQGKLRDEIVGNTAVKDDGTGQVAAVYSEIPHRPGNLIRNGGFEVYTSGTAEDPPDGWEKSSPDPTTINLEDTHANIGLGKAIKVVGSAVNGGIKQTLTGLRPSTRYLVVCEAWTVTGTAKLKTTGADAASDYQNLDGTGAQATGSATPVTLSGIIQTDSTPTDIDVLLLVGAVTEDVRFDNVAVYECLVDPVPRTGRVAAFQDLKGQTVALTADGIDLGFDQLAVTVPGPGYYIKVTGFLSFRSDAPFTANNEGVFVELTEDIDGVPAVVGNYLVSTKGSTEVLVVWSSCTIVWVVMNPTPGATYTYTLKGDIGTGGQDVDFAQGSSDAANMLVEVIPYG